MTGLEFLIPVAVLLLVAYVLWWLIGYLALPDPISKVATVILILVVLFGLLKIFGLV